MAKKFSEQIDDYKDSIFAIIGFVNFFRFNDDTKSMDNNVKVAQGRRMRTSSANRVTPNNDVTPDFCIQSYDNKGIVGEVKKSFPEDNNLWLEDFKQLMSYDDDLANWMTSSGEIDDHEIVLLPEQGRSRAIKKFFEEKKDKEITFVKNFAIVEFNRSDEANPYFFFRKEYGVLKYFDKIDKKLENGVKVPMLKLMPHYEKIKLYDSKPPLPYLLHLIWESVVMLQASSDERFPGMKRNGRLPINITAEQVVGVLHDDYSFKKLNTDNDNHQPRIPITSWVKEALDALITFKLATLVDGQKGEYTVYFKKFKNTLETFIELCTEHKLGIEPNEKQIELFDSQNSKK